MTKAFMKPMKPFIPRAEKLTNHKTYKFTLKKCLK